ncbi:hypothetical protein [Streptomyces scabiei]|uniref:hypothetical protein n=1 Tax=Streptomyces scabiei TaxID=1930 RepID=UPI00076603E1|nr:hypothetical protein [Streptomyces scabiei]
MSTEWSNPGSAGSSRIARLPFGNAARATRDVDSGTPSICLARNDTDTLPEHKSVGLHDHKES